MQSPHSLDHNSSTERTPLIPGPQNASTNVQELADSETFPLLAPFVAEMRAQDVENYTIDNLCPGSVQSRAHMTAFAFCALLHFRKHHRKTVPRDDDIWSQWDYEKRDDAVWGDISACIQKLWADFLTKESTSSEIEDLLWTAFPFDETSKKSIRGE